MDENYKILNIQIPRLKKYFGISQVDTLENKSLDSISAIHRLNSVNFEIFYPDEFYSNPDNLVKPALKIIENDTDMAYDF